MKRREFLEKCLQTHISIILHDTKYTCKYTEVYGEYIEEYGELYEVDDADIKGFSVNFVLYKDNYYDDIHLMLKFDGDPINENYVLHFYDVIRIDSRLHPDDVIEVANLSKKIIDELDKCVIGNHYIDENGLKKVQD